MMPTPATSTPTGTVQSDHISLAPVIASSSEISTVTSRPAVSASYPVVAIAATTCATSAPPSFISPTPPHTTSSATPSSSFAPPPRQQQAQKQKQKQKQRQKQQQKHPPLSPIMPYGLTRTLAHYRRIEQIGEGTYGRVYRASNIHTGERVALKKMRLHNASQGLPQTAIREIKILKALKHVNMVRLVEVITSRGAEFLDSDDEEGGEETETQDLKQQHEGSKKLDSQSQATAISTTGGEGCAGGGSDKSKRKREKTERDKKSLHRVDKAIGNLFLVLEYVSHDLTGLMDMGYVFDDIRTKAVFKQLLDALEYMHSQKFVHRDIKCSNILLDGYFRLKLADFGLARSIRPLEAGLGCTYDDALDDSTISTTGANTKKEPEYTNKVITLWYRPPELLLGTTVYGTTVDMWSAGCILAELVLGRPLLPGKTEAEQLSRIYEICGTPDDVSWPNWRELRHYASGEWAVPDRVRRPSLRRRYAGRICAAGALGLLEMLLELNPQKRVGAGRARTTRYFISPPHAPPDPSVLGPIVLPGGVDASAPDGNFHEYQTKRRRREARLAAEAAATAARVAGKDEETVAAAGAEAQRAHMADAARAVREESRRADERARELAVPMQQQTATAPPMVHASATVPSRLGGRGGRWESEKHERHHHDRNERYDRGVSGLGRERWRGGRITPSQTLENNTHMSHGRQETLTPDAVASASSVVLPVGGGERGVGWGGGGRGREGRGERGGGKGGEGRRVRSRSPPDPMLSPHDDGERLVSSNQRQSLSGSVSYPASSSMQWRGQHHGSRDDRGSRRGHYHRDRDRNRERDRDRDRDCDRSRDQDYDRYHGRCVHGGHYQLDQDSIRMSYSPSLEEVEGRETDQEAVATATGGGNGEGGGEDHSQQDRERERDRGGGGSGAWERPPLPFIDRSQHFLSPSQNNSRGSSRGANGRWGLSQNAPSRRDSGGGTKIRGRGGRGGGWR